MSETMRFECTEDSIKDTIDGVFTVLSKGDIKTVPKGWGTFAVEQGWGRDLDGAVETGERKPGAHRLSPDKVELHNS